MNFERSLQELLQIAQKNNCISFSIAPSSADIYIIAVPTPLGQNNQPDLSHVYAVVEEIKPYLRPENLILIESTCPIGTTELIAQSLKRSCRDVHIAYCPERVLPGNIHHELINNDRVVGGVDEVSTLLAVAFYQTFVLGAIHAADSKMAEAVKLAENAFRDINIAFANELSMIADRVNLDGNQLIKLANRHPRVNILEPGPGVGGHCIAIDPWFLAAAAPDIALLTSRAREVNLNKTTWVINKIREAIKKHGAKSIVCLGLTYKPNVADARESPALSIMKTLQEEIIVYCVDPYLPNTKPLNEALEAADLIVGLVAHREFLHLSPEKWIGKIVLDFGGVFK